MVRSRDGAKIYVANDTSVSVYSAETGALLDSWTVGASLGGIDLSADGTFLLVTDKQPLVTYSDHTRLFAVYKIDTATGSVTTFSQRTFNDYYGSFYDVAILADGRAVVTQNIYGSGNLDVWSLNTATGAFTSLGSNYAQAGTLTVSADHRHVLFGPGYNVGGQLDLFEIGNNNALSRTYASWGIGSSLGVQAYSEDAGLAAHWRRSYEGINIFNSHLQQTTNLLSVRPELVNVAGLAFDATGANLYVLDDDTDSIVQLSTADWSIVHTVPVGVNVYLSQNFNYFGDSLEVGPNARYFTVLTGSGLQLVTNPFASEVIDGTAADDVLTGTGLHDVINGFGGNDIIDGGAGADTMVGGTGNDIYYVDNAGDIVTENAGEGYDEVRTTLANYVLPANVEKLTYIGTGNFTYTGGGGKDDVAGNSGNDFFDLSQGGADTASGGGGNDAFSFGAAFGAGDSVDGGAGTDTVGISGDYTGANKLTTAAGQLVNVETLAMLPGAGGAVGYDIAWADGNLGAGQKMVIFAGNLQAGENLSFDGSAETHGFFVMYGGLGTEDLKGGSGSDGFYFGPGKFSQADHVDGGGGAQNQLGLDGSYDFSNGSALGTLGGNFSNIQTIALFAGDPRDASSPFPNTYHIVTNDAAVAAGKLLTIFGTPVTSNFVFDGSAESDGAFRIFSGTGDDILTGGHGNDMLYGNVGADTMTGGAGNDIFLYTDTAQSTAAKTDHILDFDAGDHIDLSQIDADTTQSGDQAFAFIGSDAFGHHAGELRAEFDQANNVWTVQGDTDGDGNADFTLLVTTVNGHQMAGTDFVP